MNEKPTAAAAVRAYLAEIGRKGGKSRSPAKLAAIAMNAKKGGWPKGRPRRPGANRAIAARKPK
jgi:general stress protein YciG